MLPRLTPEQAQLIGDQIKRRIREKGLHHRDVATMMNEDLELENPVSEHDLNSLIYRGQGLHQILLFWYLQKEELLDPEEDLKYAKVI